SFTRRNRQKNPDLLIEVARCLHLAGIRFHIDAYGEGLHCKRLASEVARRGLTGRVVFHAPVDDPAAAMAHAHVYLSTSRWEGMPLAVLEAWRAGLLVVASDVVGNRDLVNDGKTGWLFPDGNGRAAARAIKVLLTDPARAERVRQRAAHQASLDHAHDLMALRLLWLYRHTLAMDHAVDGTRKTTTEAGLDSWPQPSPRPFSATANYASPNPH
ncbi:MAG: glycosyltransferase, partial [Planctomycetota bacterium]